MAKSPGCLETAGGILTYVEQELDSKDQKRIDKIYDTFGAGKDFDPVDLTQFITQVFEKYDISNFIIVFK